MHTFFHGWRRKAGAVTLVMACLLCGMWIRSRVLIDFCETPLGDRVHSFGSFHGYLSWRSWNSNSNRGNSWQTLPAQAISPEILLGLNLDSLKHQTREWVIPHSWIAAPLTLLSAYLILWKPRKRNIEPHHVTGVERLA
eukprot:TRINITY_DN9286_c0_g1_i4.p1 TRINITY_DN9286_c0_g1~~TRINITY_DN9286_c0_g1_i4.p1  ORF type:complete len:139 (-),score=3.17 TRINITY_DN9286_c0_g1_i4:19-435(-)